MQNDICGDADAAVEFLEQWRSRGPWVLTAIHPDRKSIETRTFCASQGAACREWIDGFNGNRNLYFHVNPCTKELTKKALVTEVAALAWLHVDIDPRVGEDIEEERARALRLLQEFTPAPTVIIFSGGGYQGFWRLEDPLPIDGDVAKAEHAKLYNLALESALGADACHNVDRIMRLPGTINLPDKNKLAKGRTKVLATLVEFNDNVYPLSTFTKAARIRIQGAPASGPAVRVDVSGDVQRLDSVDELSKWNVPDRVKVIIVQGRLPNEPKGGDDSRSAWLFDVVCNLVRCDVPDDVIYSVITDPDFGISESVLAASSTEKYALKQIASAKEFAIDPALHETNERFFVVADEGSKCRVAFFRRQIFEQGQTRDVLVFQSFTDFRNRFMNQLVEAGADKQGNPKFEARGSWWLKHPRRRQYEQIEFLPGADAGDDVFNLWRGFAYEPRRGSCRLMLRHMFDVLACRDGEALRYILRWAAWSVQNPAECAEVALVFRGGRGTGKGTFGRWMKKLFGQHGLQVVSPKHITGRFNAHLRDCCLLFADEAIAPGDVEAEGVLKGFLTEPTLPIEAKGRDLIEGPNHLHVIMSSNEQWVVPAGPDERRFAVFDVSDAHKQDLSWFGAIDREMRRGGAEALLDLLLRMKLGDWHPRQAIPRTQALVGQKVASLRRRPLDHLLFEWLWTGDLPLGEEHADGHRWVKATWIVDRLADRYRYETSARTVVDRLKAVFQHADGTSALRYRKEKGDGRWWGLPRLEEARSLWERNVFQVDGWGEGDLPEEADVSVGEPF